MCDQRRRERDGPPTTPPSAAAGRRHEVVERPVSLPTRARPRSPGARSRARPPRRARAGGRAPRPATTGLRACSRCRGRRRLEARPGEASGCPVRDEHVHHLVAGQMTALHERRPRPELHERPAGALHVVGSADARAHQHRRLVRFGVTSAASGTSRRMMSLLGITGRGGDRPTVATITGRARSSGAAAARCRRPPPPRRGRSRACPTSPRRAESSASASSWLMTSSTGTAPTPEPRWCSGPSRR